MNYPEISKVRTIDLLNALANARLSLTKLQGKGKKYDALIKAILTFPNRDSEEHSPGGQELQVLLNVTSTKLRNWSLELYDDLLTFFNEDNPVVFTRHRVQFAVYGYKGRHWFTAELTTLPRIGEQVNFPFLYPIVGSIPLYVEKIEYTYENDTARVLIMVNNLNPYLLQLKQRAEFEKRFDQFDLMAHVNLSSFEVEELLYRWYGKG